MSKAKGKLAESARKRAEKLQKLKDEKEEDKAIQNYLKIISRGLDTSKLPQDELKNLKKIVRQKYSARRKQAKIPTTKVEPGICFTNTGKIKRDRYSVYYEYYTKTPSGLTKADLVKKGNKILSKKMVERGKKLQKAFPKK